MRRASRRAADRMYRGRARDDGARGPGLASARGAGWSVRRVTMSPKPAVQSEPPLTDAPHPPVAGSSAAPAREAPHQPAPPVPSGNGDGVASDNGKSAHAPTAP